MTELYVGAPGEGTLAGGRGPLVEAFGDHSGTYAYCPPGLVHGFANRGDEPMRFVGVGHPGVERMLVEMGNTRSR